MADPRGLRGGQAEDEEEAASRGAVFGKALLAIVLALVIGAGAAYGYYIYSTPKVPSNAGQPSSAPSGDIRGHSMLALDEQPAYVLIHSATQA